MKLIELMVAFVGLPEQYAEIESILVLVGLGLAVVLGSLFNNLIVQPGFVLFLDRVRSVLSELGLTKKQDAKLSALEKRDKAQTKRLDDLDAKMDNVLAVLDTNNTLIQANSKAISALGDSQIQLDDDQSDVFASSGEEEEGWDEPAPELDDLQITVHIKTDSPGVPVTVDGRSVGVTPAVVDLADGDHEVKLGPGGAGGTFTIAPLGNPDSWCFAAKGSGYKQTLCN